MAMSHIKYNYSFDLTYVGSDGQTFDISPEKIISVFISEDFDNNNMPLIFVTLSLDKKQIALMSQTTETAKMIMSQYKFIVGNDMGTIKELCFRNDFAFFMDTGANFINDLDYDESGENENQLFRKVNIGLLMLEHVNGTRTQLDGVFSGTNMVNLVYSFLGNRPVLIEPFLDNSVKSNIIVPPSNSVSQLLAKLNNISAFYDTYYRFYQGLDCTYLLSSSGKAVPKKNEKLSKVIININPVSKTDEQAEGIYIHIDDNTNQQLAYVLEVPTTSKSVCKNIAKAKAVNTIDGVDANGNLITKTEELDPKTIVGTKRRLMRIPNGNTRKVDISVDELGDSTYIEINKNNMDTTIFTINKEYWITFNDGSEGENGQYVLGKKNDIYTRFEDNFMCTTKLLFY